MKKSLKKDPWKEDFFTDVLTELTYVMPICKRFIKAERYSCPESII